MSYNKSRRRDDLGDSYFVSESEDADDLEGDKERTESQPAPVRAKTPEIKSKHVLTILGLPGGFDDDPAYPAETQFITVRPSIVRVTGGGVASLIAAGIEYWTAFASSDGKPRSRPQPDIHDPAWMYQSAGCIADYLGLDCSSRQRKGQRAVIGAIEKLSKAQLVTQFELDAIRMFDFPWNKGLRLTRLYWNRIKDDIITNQQVHFICVPRSYMSEWKLDANSALLLAYFHLRCIQYEKKLRVRIDGELHFAASVRQISHETGLTDKQVRCASAKLLSRDPQMLIAQKCLFRGHPTLHWRFSNYGRELLARYAVIRDGRVDGKKGNSKRGNAQSHKGERCTQLGKWEDAIRRKVPRETSNDTE